MPSGVYIRTKQICDNIGKSKRGNKNPKYWLGKRRSNQTKEKIKNSLLGNIPWNKGIPCDRKTKNKIHLSNIGKTPWNKGKVGVQIAWNKGKETSKEIKKKLSLSHRGQIAWNKGKQHSEKTKQKIREARLKRVTPNFNSNACRIIDNYGKRYGYKFQHAENGGEIRVVGYSLDGYDKKKNVVIEYYENRHRKQWRKDLVRQRRIMKALNCRFVIIKEWEI